MKMDACIVGLGAVSPMGAGVSALTRDLENRLPELIASPFSCSTHEGDDWSGSVPDSVFELDNAKLKRMPRCNRLALMAVDEALSHSGIKPSDESASVGIFYCTDHGPESQTCRFLDTLFLKTPRLVSPLLFQNTTFAAGAGEISMRHGVQGPSYSVVNGFQGMLTAIDLASMALSLGRINYAILVATDELNTLQQQSLVSMGLARDVGASTVKVAHGFAPAEGAAALILTSPPTCRARHHKPLASIMGVGHGHDAMSHRRTDPEGTALALAMRAAVGGEDLSCVSSIWLAANGHPVMDKAERCAIDSFGATPGNVPCIALKHLIGESHAAAPGLQIISSIHSAVNGLIPQSTPFSLINALSPGGGAASLLLAAGPDRADALID